MACQKKQAKVDSWGPRNVTNVGYVNSRHENHMNKNKQVIHISRNVNHDKYIIPRYMNHVNKTKHIGQIIRYTVPRFENHTTKDVPNINQRKKKLSKKMRIGL